ncbi:MAG: hypothetical protein LBG87_02680 [Spirochaetaceae bacterium]|jgi:hypothetical protein|nr:hypothetical protein [Spirochaetaceae bacterium]
MKKILPGIILIPLLCAAILQSCEWEAENEKSKFGATWTGWPKDGAKEEENTTSIRFTFSKPVNALSAGDFSITEEGASGYAEVQSVTQGNEHEWFLGVNAKSEGLMKVTIHNSDIEKTLHGVPVFKELSRVDYTVEPVPPNPAPTTDLVFTFEQEDAYFPDGIKYSPTADDITLEGGVIMNGPLGGDLLTYTLPITVLQAGEVQVSISKPGIVKESKPVIVCAPPVDYTVTPSPNDPSKTTTALVFAFQEPVWLDKDEITLNIPTVEKGGDLSYSGDRKQWTLPVIVTEDINGTVSISNSGIVPDAKPVNVYKGKIYYTVLADGFSHKVTSTQLTFTFNEPVNDLNIDQITLVPDRKKEGTPLSGSGKTWVLTLKDHEEEGLTVTVGQSDEHPLGHPAVEEASQVVQIYKADPPPPPADPDPLKPANIRLSLNLAGKNGPQLELRNADAPNQFPYGDTKQEHVDAHKSYYSVQIAAYKGTSEASYAEADWKNAGGRPTIFESPSKHIRWTITSSDRAKVGGGAIAVRVRAKNTNAPQEPANWGAYVYFMKNGGY